MEEDKRKWHNFLREEDENIESFLLHRYKCINVAIDKIRRVLKSS